MYWVLLLVFLYLLLLFIKGPYYTIQIPAVINNTGILSTFKLTDSFGNGKLYVSNTPFKDYLTQLSFEFSRLAFCSLFNCYNKNYYLTIDTTTLFIEGPSASAGVFILLSSTVLGFPKEIPITGFLIPNGIILPVGGIKQKVEASKGNIVIPYLEDYDKGVKAMNIFDLLRIYFNYEPKEKKYNLKKYKEIIEKIAEDICSYANDSKALYYLSKGHYYTAASLCFSDVVKNINKTVNKTEIINFIRKVEKIKCRNYICEEIKYNVLDRAYEALNSNGTYAYWRFYTAKQWLQFINLTSDRKPNCRFYKDLFNIMNSYFALETSQELKLKNYTCIGYKISTLPAFLVLEYKYGANATKLLYVLWNTTEDYLKYKGFSVAAYNYLQYSKDLYKMNDTKSAIYYATLALLYAMT